MKRAVMMMIAAAMLTLGVASQAVAQQPPLTLERLAALDEDDFAAYSPLDLTALPAREAATVLGVVSPLEAALFAQSEGRPSLTVQIARRSSGAGVIVAVTRGGFLDDSVAGDRTVLILERAPGGAWRVVAGYRQNLCARAGMGMRFMAGPCP